MFNKEDCYYLAKITRTHGINGAIVAKFDCDDIYEYSNLESVFVEYRKKLIPYFVSSIRISNEDTAIIQFEDINSDTIATEMLINCSMYLPLDCLPELTNDEFYMHDMVGFTVVDSEEGEIGKIEEVLEYSANTLFKIMNGKKEVLIPVAKEFIEKVDKENKLLNVKLPEGLLDLYKE